MVEPGRRPGGFFDELKRRRVVRVALAYGTVVFVLLQLAEIILPALDYSEAALRPLLIASLIGFPIVLLLAWLYDLTPEGVVRTARDARSAGRIVMPIRGLAALAAALVALGGVAAAVLILRPYAAEGAVAEDARVIAVMPFAGSSENIMAEGVMDLLSRNLDGIGSIRTIDPVRTLNRLRADEQTGDMLDERAREVGTLLGAGSVLTGRISTIGATVSLSASLIATSDGSQLAAAEVRGTQEQMFELIDRLSSRILEIVWRGDDLPSFDVASFTTSNFNAIRAFLEGERYYRASQWDSAMASFARAIDEDEEFALAYYRFATSAGWGGAFRPSQIGRSGRIDPTAGNLVGQASELAREFSEGLPERERLLIAAQWLRVNGRREEALDTMRALVRRFPDDIEAAYLMADDVYHLQDEPAGLLRRPLAQQLALFDDVLEQEPGFRPAMIHPIEVAFAAGRIDLVERYLGYLRPANPLDEAALGTYGAALAALSERDVFAFAGALETALGAREQTGFVWQAANGVLPALLVAAAGLDADDREELIAYLTDGLEDLRSETREQRALMAADLLIASGRPDEALALLDRPGIARLVSEERQNIAARAAMAGLLPAPSGGPDWLRTAVRGLAAIDAGDAAGIRRAMAEAANRDLVADSVRGKLLREALAGFLTAAQGDTTAALASLEATLARSAPDPGSLEEALWLRWAVRAVQDQDRREAAVRALSSAWRGSGVYEVARLGLRAVGLRLAGSPDAAFAEEAWCGASAGTSVAEAPWAGPLRSIPCDEADGLEDPDDTAEAPAASR
jgi:TolB-like protein